LPCTDFTQNRFLKIVRITTSCFFIKFAAGSAVSLMLSVSPVWLSGPRHTLWLFAGVVLLWLSPGDIVYDSMRHSSAVRLVLGMGGGLYKMRKAIFAVEVAACSCPNMYDCSFSLALLVAVLAIDGNTLVRRAVLWFEARLAESHGCMPGLADCYSALCRVGRDACIGVWTLLWNTVVPLTIVTAMIWSAARSEWANGVTDTSFLGLRACLLAYFIWRSGSFHEMANIHFMSLRVADAAAHNQRNFSKEDCGIIQTKIKKEE